MMGEIDLKAAQDAWTQAEFARIMTVDSQEAAHLAERQHELEASLIAAAKTLGRSAGDGRAAHRWWEQERPPRRPLRIAIVGGGVGGLAMGARLREAGYDDFVILEKSDDIGGTWHHNNYPGVACDVASYFYSFTFFKNPGWSQMFAPGSEIKRYLSELADHYRLREHIRFGATVTSCHYDNGVWTISTAEGETFEANIFIPATGFLHIPILPAIEGRDRFAGEIFHSSAWRPDFDSSGKRVGIIGNGSSSVQIVSNIVDRVDHLTVFQRTAQWVFPAPNDYYSELRQQMLSYYPELTHRLFQFFMDWYNDGFGNAVTGDAAAQKRFADACQANLDSIADPELRAKLTPDYPVMCKRLIFSSTYFDALQRSNCALETRSIARIEPSGVRLPDGSLVELDVLVLATGFDTHAYCRSLNISAAGGQTLNQAWQDGARSFESIGLAGFPNLFFIGGPYSTVGNLSTMTCAELQVDHVIRLLDEMDRTGAREVMPHRDAEDAFVDEMQGAVANTVWVSGCKSWYLDAKGGIDIWTKSPAAFMDRMVTGPDLAKYHFKA